MPSKHDIFLTGLEITVIPLTLTGSFTQMYGNIKTATTKKHLGFNRKVFGILSEQFIISLDFEFYENYLTSDVGFSHTNIFTPFPKWRILLGKGLSDQLQGSFAYPVKKVTFKNVFLHEFQEMF